MSITTTTNFPARPRTKYSYSVHITPPTELNNKEYPVPFPALERANFTPYNIFCLRSKIDEYLKLRNPSYEVEFSPRQIGDMMVMTPEIYDGGEKLSDDDTYELLPDSVIEMFQSEDEDYCLCYSERGNVKTEDVFIPETWIRSVLSYIPVPRVIEYNESINIDYYNQNVGEKKVKTVTFDAKYKNILGVCGIYLRLSNDMHYQAITEKIVEYITNVLIKLYGKGCVPLDEKNEQDMDFAERWMLRKDNYELYSPTWDNGYLGSNKVDVLTRMRAGGVVTIEVDDVTKTDNVKLARSGVRYEIVKGGDGTQNIAVRFYPNTYIECDYVMSIFA